MMSNDIEPTEESPKKESPFRWLVTTVRGYVFVICLVLSIFVSYLIYERTGGLKNLNWTETQGVITECQLLGNKGALATAFIQYSYDVGEMNYEKSYRNQFDGFAYRVGDKVKVLYNPEDTNQSRLDLGFSLDVLALSLVDLGFVIGVIWAFFRHIKQLKRTTYEGFEDFEPYYKVESSN